jgi:dynein heavy chain 2
VEIRKSCKINFSTMYCNSQTNANHVIQKLYAICSKANSGAGKILRPKDCARQVLYLKDINLPKPDKYQTIQLASFLQQVISHKGFYDPTNLEFVQLDEKIQIVVSMFPPSSIGRNQLTPRFTAIVKILNIDYPSLEDLALIYTEYFRALLRQKKLDEGSSRSFATLFVEIYSAVKKNFTVDEHRHYSITPKSLLEIFKNLTLYETQDAGALVESLVYEFGCWRCRLVGADKKAKFDQLLSALVKNQFKTAPKNDLLFSYLSGKYVRVKREDYVGVVKSTLVLYEREYQDITFVPSDEAVGWVASIEKVLASQNNPNLLLVGVSGVARQTNLQIAALILKMDILRLPTLRDFGAR